MVPPRAPSFFAAALREVCWASRPAKPASGHGQAAHRERV
jgi:hypothetical protein